MRLTQKCFLCQHHNDLSHLQCVYDFLLHLMIFVTSLRSKFRLPIINVNSHEHGAICSTFNSPLISLFVSLSQPFAPGVVWRSLSDVVTMGSGITSGHVLYKIHLYAQQTHKSRVSCGLMSNDTSWKYTHTPNKRWVHIHISPRML